MCHISGDEVCIMYYVEYRITCIVYVVYFVTVCRIFVTVCRMILPQVLIRMWYIACRMVCVINLYMNYEYLMSYLINRI